MAIFLVIKGSAKVAVTAARKRGIIVAIQRETYSETTALALYPDDLPKIVDWFCEEPSEAPYPEGALLWYRSID